MAACVLLHACWCAAQSTSATATLTFQFLDSKTGASVKPAAVALDGSPVTAQSDASGLLVLRDVADGPHQVQVDAEKYQRLEATATADGANTLVQTFELDPVPGAEDEETTPSAGEALIRGTVVDDLRGSMLAGAHVRIGEKAVETTADDKGRYAIRFPANQVKTARGELAGGERVTVKAEAEGYRPREIRNVEAAPGTSVHLPIRMRKPDEVDDDAATSGTDVTEQAAPLVSQRNYEWVFDVTTR